MAQVVIKRPNWQELFVATALLDDAEIKALPTTAIEIVAAPGAGKVIYPLFVTLKATLTAAYTGIDTEGSYLLTSVGESGWLEYAQNVGAIDSVLGDTAVSSGPVLAFMRQSDRVQAADTSLLWFVAAAVTNQPLTLSMFNSGNLTGGNAANSLALTTLYHVFDV